MRISTVEMYLLIYSSCSTYPIQLRALRTKYKATPTTTPTTTNSGLFANIPPVISPRDTANIATNMNQPLGITINLPFLTNNDGDNIPYRGTPALDPEMVPL